MKIRPVGAELIHADRWRETDKKRIIFAFRCFVNAPKNCWHIPGSVKIWEI